MNIEKHITKPFAIVLDGNGGIKETLKTIDKNASSLWINLNYKDPEITKTLKEHGLDNYTINNLISDNPHQKTFFIEEKNAYLIILRNYKTKPSNKKYSSLRVYIQKDKIITLTHNQSEAIIDTYNLLKKSKGATDIIECFTHIILKNLTYIYENSLKISNNIDSIEEEIIKNKNINNNNFYSKTSKIRKHIINAHRYLNLHQDTFKNITNDISFFNNKKYKNDFRYINNYINKIIDNLEYSHKHIFILKEDIENNINISINNNMYILSLIITIFTPLTLITGMLGINVGGIPYAKSDYAFGVVCILLLSIGILSYIFIRRFRNNQQYKI